MKVSLNWLKDYVDIQHSPERVGEILTSLGLEVEGQEEWVSIPGELAGIVVGHVLTCGKHPGADRLSLTTVDIGADEPVQIVCGAPNVAAGQHVLVATIGAVLHPLNSDPFQIKKGKIRGEVSMGMICAEEEIGIGSANEGILVLNKAYAPGTPASEVFPVERDVVFEVGLTPNRSDATSHRGVAADLRAYLVIHEKYSQPLKPGKAGALVASLSTPARALDFTVKVLNPELCPRYAGLILEGIAVKESPAWLKNRLKALGVRPINNVVDATNFILHDLGQPLHAFDLAKVGGNGIHVRTLPQNTLFTTLDEQERKLNETDLIICDANDTPLCIAGVFGGIGSGVTESTTSIFLESAYFEPRNLRRTATRHDLHTDAARTFEKGVDPARVVDSLKAAAGLLIELTGGTASGDVVDINPAPVVARRISLSFDQLEALSGVVLPKGEVKKILEALAFTIVEENEAYLLVDAGTDRADVVREADVIEEVLRVYGFDNVPLPRQIKLTPAVSRYPSAYVLRRRAAEYLIGQGLNETMGLSLVPSKIYEALQPEVVDSLVRIHNTSTVELDAMRLNLVPTGLQAIAYNQNRQQLDLAFFEFGKGYKRVGEEKSPTEYEQLAIWITGARSGEHWAGKMNGHKTSFSHARGLAEGVFRSIGVVPSGEEFLEKEGIFAYAQNLLIDGEPAATVGRISEEYITYFDTKSSEIYLALIHWPIVAEKAVNTGKTIEEISRYPQVRRDLAVVVDKSVTFGQIAELTREPSGKLVKSVELFDVYEDKERLGVGKRSYAIRFVFERLDRTLNDKEVDKAMSAVVNVLDAQPNMEVRR